MPFEAEARLLKAAGQLSPDGTRAPPEDGLGASVQFGQGCVGDTTSYLCARRCGRDTASCLGRVLCWERAFRHQTAISYTNYPDFQKFILPALPPDFPWASFACETAVNIVQITPGAGAMYCGNCLRDNALVRELRRMGHEVLMVPLYLPLTLDEKDESAGTPVFFSGISVYLEQQAALFRHAPEWLDRILASRRLLKLAAGRAAKTRAEQLGPLTLSMLNGSSGNQAREVRKLIRFLKSLPRPGVICLSNLLLTGLVQPLKEALGTAVVCMVQGEDSFLDALPASSRQECWAKVAENASKANLLLATSHYYGDLIRDKLGLPAEKMKVVHSGITLEGYEVPADLSRQPRTLGFFARMCLEKGLDTVVEAFIALKGRGRVPELRLKVGGSCGPSDEPLVRALQTRLEAEGLARDVEWHPNTAREEKIRFLQSLSVFSVPARYGEAFGLYLVEAMAAGVPLVQPRAAAFPELIQASGAGLLCRPEDPAALAEAVEQVLLDPALAGRLASAGLRAAREQFSVSAMARTFLGHFASVQAPGAEPSRVKAGAVAFQPAG